MFSFVRTKNLRICFAALKKSILKIKEQNNEKKAANQTCRLTETIKLASAEPTTV